MTCDTNLRTLLAIGWIKASSIREISEKQIEECLLKRCQKDENGENLYLINDVVVSKVEMKMHILEAEDSILSLHQDYLMKLQNNEYGTIP